MATVYVLVSDAELDGEQFVAWLETEGGERSGDDPLEGRFSSDKGHVWFWPSSPDDPEFLDDESIETERGLLGTSTRFRTVFEVLDVEDVGERAEALAVTAVERFLRKWPNSAVYVPRSPPICFTADELKARARFKRGLLITNVRRVAEGQDAHD